MLWGPRAINRALAWIAGIGIALLMLPTVVDVTYRKLFGPSIPGLLEYGEVGLVVVVFLGMAHAMETGTHVYTPILTSRLPGRVSGALRLAGLVPVWVLVALMVVGTARLALESIEIGEYTFGLAAVPIWPAKVAIPIGLAAMLVELTIRICECAGTLRGAGRPAGEPGGGAPGTGGHHAG